MPTLNESIAEDAALRGALLPKLLSGELLVAAATLRNCRIVQTDGARNHE